MYFCVRDIDFASIVSYDLRFTGDDYPLLFLQFCQDIKYDYLQYSKIGDLPCFGLLNEESINATEICGCGTQ
jgi:hypothetical protein